jgi:hypothetical protein
MSDRQLWRYGDTNPVAAAVDPETEIEVGSLVFQDVDDAKPASSQADQGSKTANQELFTNRFLGVAMNRSRAGDNSSIRVAATGVFEFDCPGDTFELGDLVGCDENSVGTALLNQQVVKVAKSKYAIGRVAKRSGVITTTVLVSIRSTVMTGGVEGSTGPKQQ